ncbi:hypothetical protein [Helicobacter valdiviensis]|uniref:hypothetical protein n=1 Tax=Helicobacter valdiviensis TaxID=1458358 RepID=UPI0015EB4C1A|nr:hypothetical protein [Helicobacter valdiviensis]
MQKSHTYIIHKYALVAYLTFYYKANSNHNPNPSYHYANITYLLTMRLSSITAECYKTKHLEANLRLFKYHKRALSQYFIATNKVKQSMTISLL